MRGKGSDENARIEQLARMARFSGFTDGEIDLVLDAATYLTVPEGWAMMAENTPADKAYLIREMALVNHKLRSATVVTETPLEALHFTDAAVAALTEKIPHFKDALTGVAEERSHHDQGD
jgi:CRP/FNR family cyclic AMP-dependent transcriptional regulator